MLQAARKINKGFVIGLGCKKPQGLIVMVLQAAKNISKGCAIGLCCKKPQGFSSGSVANILKD